jgi:hypothetical protein
MRKDEGDIYCEILTRNGHARGNGAELPRIKI